MKQGSSFNYSGKNLGITDSFNVKGQKPGVKVLSFDVVHPNKDLQDSLFLKPSEFVYAFNACDSWMIFLYDRSRLYSNQVGTGIV